MKSSKLFQDGKIIELINESIYDHPKYYDLVFGADCASEIRFILDCCKRFLDKAARSFFEPACGTGRLIQYLAKRGYNVCGIDLNSKAIGYCNDRMQRHGLKPRTFVADMSNFHLEQEFDVGFNTINSFRHLCSETAARSHLRCMGRVIREKGLYILGIHLTPTLTEPLETESWSARRGLLAINSHMWTEQRNPKKRIDKYGIQFDVHKPSGSLRIQDELVMRSYTANQMNKLLASAKCWEIVKTFDFACDIDSPVTVDGTTEDVIYVLRRVAC